MPRDGSFIHTNFTQTSLAVPRSDRSTPRDPLYLVLWVVIVDLLPGPKLLTFLAAWLPLHNNVWTPSDAHSKA